MAGAGLLLVWSAQTADLRPGALLDERGQANALELLEGFTHPDFTPDFVERIQRLTLESLAIGLAGMALAVALGIPLALIAARLPGLLDTPGSRS
ncbi:MAG: ABC-type phosphate/phosphonate transport system permease subunit, partial [Myxococcota bacterium]